MQQVYVKRVKFYRLYQFNCKVKHYIWQMPRVSKSISFVLKQLNDPAIFKQGAKRDLNEQSFLSRLRNSLI